MWNRQEDLNQSPVPSEGVGSAVLRGSAVFDTPNEWLTVQQTAEFLGKGLNTVANWCKTGKIAAIPTEYGRKVSYRIPSQAVIAMRESLKSKESMSIYRKTIKATVVHTHRELIDTFLKFCEQGLHNESGNPYSPETLKYRIITVACSPEIVPRIMRKTGLRFHLKNEGVLLVKDLVRIPAIPCGR